MRRRQIGDRERAVREGRRAVLAVILLVMAGALHWSGGPLIPDLFSPKNRAAKAVQPSPGETLTTASILIPPREGNICERRLIDNATWTIYRDGYVSCDDVLSRAPHGSAIGTASRIEAIRDGFFQRR